MSSDAATWEREVWSREVERTATEIVVASLGCHPKEQFGSDRAIALGQKTVALIREAIIRHEYAKDRLAAVIRSAEIAAAVAAEVPEPPLFTEPIDGEQAGA